MPRLPKLSKLEIRGEGLLTAHPNPGPCCNPGFVYYDLRYISGYTNNANILGNWIGRAGWGGQGWTTYNFSPRSKIQLGYRGQHVDRLFIGGGNLSDVGAKTDFTLRDELTLSGGLQYEHWNFPQLEPAAHDNLAISFELSFFPRWNRK
jgi:hypothetical protein